MLDFLSKGGVLVIPIGICSVIALAVFIERMLFFLLLRQKNRGVVNAFVGYTHGQKSPDEIAASEASQTPLGRILTELLSVRECDPPTRQAAIREAFAHESRHLAARLQLLATIGNITPLLGLLGTITGMIKAFMVIQESGGKVDPSALAGGIWEAMLTTALGLAVALPVMMAHSYLVSCVETREASLKSGIVRYMKETTTP